LIGRYLQEVPSDPWGHDYLLNGDLKLLACYGKDGRVGGSGEAKDLFFLYANPEKWLTFEDLTNAQRQGFPASSLRKDGWMNRLPSH
jgi:hypothetical protein